jgi:hypothetical protein
LGHLPHFIAYFPRKLGQPRLLGQKLGLHLCERRAQLGIRQNSRPSQRHLKLLSIARRRLGAGCAIRETCQLI